MTDSAIAKIKKAESEAAASLENAKAEVDSLVQKTTKEFEQNLSEAENLASPEIGAILTEAQKSLQGLKIKHDAALAKELEKIKSVSSQKIKAAAETIVKAILK